jgi:lipid II isoglutaminyl synthase (glutamine-hydrolysing)
VAEVSAVRVALVYPDLLGTYGDSGNAVILSERLRWRGHDTEVITVTAGGLLPDSCDIYVLGGGEDLPQVLAASQLGAGRPLHRAVGQGAAILAVCAGLQILGSSFAGTDGIEHQGLGLLDCYTRLGRRRAVGELVVEPAADLELPTLTGYENHGGVTVLGPDARPIGTVKTGVGNGDGTDGVIAGRIWATYMHGPVLARNPLVADRILACVVGSLAPLDDHESEALRAERLRAAQLPSRHRLAPHRLALAWRRRASLI